MLKQSASGDRPCREKRETCEKGTMWTDWTPTSFSPSRSSRLSRQAILRECVPVVPHVVAIEVLLCQNGFSAACKTGNYCYRSFASVASIVFILLRVFYSPASPGHHNWQIGQARWSLTLGRANEVQIGIRSGPA
jgi:hypothetical protein